MIGLYRDPEGKTIFSAHEQHSTPTNNPSQTAVGNQGEELALANRTIDTLRKRVTELESSVSHPHKQVSIALLKMGHYYNTTLCHYWYMSVK